MPDEHQTAESAGREIVATRIFDAPRDLVFRLWTDPHHVAKWWGPNGFTTTVQEMDVRPGGAWHLIMHGPDGTDYPNKSVFVEVSPPHRLVYDHVSGPAFRMTATFEERDGKTHLTARMVFATAELRDKTDRQFGAVKGLGQTLDRLGQQVAAAVGSAAGVQPFVISRTFDVPRERMFELWTQRDHLMKWFGPKGWSMTYGKLDLRPGGLFHYSMRMANGAVMWGKFAYREVTPPERLVWVNSFSDENAGLGRHPLAPEWPPEMLTTVSFAEQDGKTTVTIHWVPINPSDVERRTFDAGRGSMTMGWTGTLDQLTAYVASI